MANTIPDGIYYPENTTDMELDTILASMASSIQNGIGKRLKHQEIAVGLKASVPSNGYNIPVVNTSTIPYVVTSGSGDFNLGMTLSAGVIVVGTAGMYLVTATLGTLGGTTGRGLKVLVRKNSVMIAGLESPQTTGIWGASSVTTVLNCVPGDTIRAEGAITGSGAAATGNNGESTHIAVSMVQALPL